MVKSYFSSKSEPLSKIRSFSQSEGIIYNKCYHSLEGEYLHHPNEDSSNLEDAYNAYSKLLVKFFKNQPTFELFSRFYISINLKEILGMLGYFSVTAFSFKDEGYLISYSFRERRFLRGLFLGNILNRIKL
jgi:hypothetical protein